MKAIVLAILLSAGAAAQFTTTASHIRPVAALPASCSIIGGDVVFLRTGTVGIYMCGPTANNWTFAGAPPGLGITTLNGLTAATQVFAIDSSGTDVTISSATATHTFHFPSASASNRGLLTSADWTTFNGKVSMTWPSGGAGIAFYGGSSAWGTTLADPLTVAHGGTGTVTPSLVSGTGITVTGSFPNQTITATGGGSAAVSTLGGIPDVVRTNSTTLTVGAQCVAAPNCIVRFGNTSYALVAAVTAVITSTSAPGTAHLYVANGGTLTLGYDSNITMGTCTGITCTPGISAFPYDAIPLYKWTAASNIWDTSGGTNWIGVLSTKKVTCTGACTQSESNGTTNFDITGSGATIPSVTNIIKGNGSGNGADTKVAITSPTTAATLIFGTDNASLTLQGTGTVVNRDSTDTLTNKTFGQTVLPSTDSTYNLGSGSFYWAGVYSLNGNFFTSFAKGYQVYGQQFTASGCSNGTLVGGSTAGSYLSGTSGTCTVTVTMGGSQTATTQWACHASNVTTTSNVMVMTTSNTTTATFSGVTVSGDKIVWSCLGF